MTERSQCIPHARVHRVALWLIVAGLALGAAACGKKGPLYLPDEAPAAKAQPQKPAPPQPEK